MTQYKQFTIENRENLINFYNQGLSQTEIGSAIGFSQSAVSRELARNRNAHTRLYDPDRAQSKALLRKKRGCKIDKNLPLKALITDKLHLGWTPEQIAERVKIENHGTHVSHETIYQWIYQPIQKKAKLYKTLIRHKSKRGPRKGYEAKAHKMLDKKSIHIRPEQINSRETFGHWEGDLMVGKNCKSQVLTLLERKSRFFIIAKLDSKKADLTGQKISDIVMKLKAKGMVSFDSLTLDNGTEFNDFMLLEKQLGIPIYFCDPYASWQKGAVENSNGIARRTIPKKSDFNDYTDDDINNLMWNMNTTPRKCLGYKTPYEVIAKQELRLATLGNTVH
jgi:IS30 family transposase